MFLTAASPSPFDSGLYGKLSSCLIPLLLQICAKSVLFAGPPSVHILFGQPKTMNQSSSFLTTVAVHLSLIVHSRRILNNGQLAPAIFSLERCIGRCLVRSWETKRGMEVLFPSPV